MLLGSLIGTQVRNQTETFETTPVEVELESLDGNVKCIYSTSQR